MLRLVYPVALGAFLCSPSALLADFQYQETTQITGGSVMGLMKMAGAFSSQARKADQPVTSTVMVKGNRMLRMRPDSMEIIDLDRGTITEVDTVKRQYTTTTFEQLKQQLEQARAKAEREQATAQQKAANAKDPASKDANVDMSFDIHVRNTGTAKQVSGVDTNEAILTMSMVAQDKSSLQKGAFAITNDMWMAPEIPGYAEVRAFDEKLAKRMGNVLSGGSTPAFSALLTQPGAAKGLANLAEEMQKLKGVPVMQVMRMGATADGQPLPAASEGPLPPSATPQLPSAGDVAQQTATSVIANKIGGIGGALAGGGLGGFGGFGKKKKAEPAPAADTSPSTQQAQAAGANVLIESNTTLGGFSSAPVDPSHFEIPAGYKEVSPKTQENAS